MGRDLSWYVIPKNVFLEHDTAKFCVDLEFEPKHDELRGILAAKLGASVPWFYQAVQKEQDDILNGNSHLWCPKCILFTHGLYDLPELLASKHISHSYSDPIWISDWNIKGMYMGCDTTEFCRRFSRNNMYNEIRKDDVERASRSLRDLGEPIRTPDKEAREESLEVLEFIEKFMNDDDVVVIFQDES